MTFQLTDDQIEHALALCEVFPPRTGMYVSPPSWSTIDAFISGYVASWPEDANRALHNFVNERFGPSNIVWTSRLRQMHDPDTDRNADLGRERGQEVAELLFAVVRDFVQDQRDK